MRTKDGEKAMWKHREEAEEQISLHDCRATQITVEENRICMGFADGFWMIQNTAHNPSGETIKTTRSQVVFYLDQQNADEAEVAVFRRKQLKGKKIAVREVRNLAWLIKMVNGQGVQLEFVEAYRQCSDRLYKGYLYAKRPPYWLECELVIPRIEKIEYCWNELDPENIW